MLQLRLPLARQSLSLVDANLACERSATSLAPSWFNLVTSSCFTAAACCACRSFGQQLLKLVLMPALLLFALFFYRLAIVFKGLSRMIVLIFQGWPVRLVLSLQLPCPQHQWTAMKFQTRLATQSPSGDYILVSTMQMPVAAADRVSILITPDTHSHLNPDSQPHLKSDT